MFVLIYKDRLNSGRLKCEYFNSIASLMRAIIDIIDNSNETDRILKWCETCSFGSVINNQELGYRIESFSNTKLRKEIQNVCNEITKQTDIKNCDICTEDTFSWKFSIEHTILKYNHIRGYILTVYDKISNKKIIEIASKDSNEIVEESVRALNIIKKSNNKPDYSKKATAYAERFGIITYKVKGKYLIYNTNFNEKNCINGKWKSKTVTYQRVVNLDTMEVTSKKLARAQKNGWDNT